MKRITALFLCLLLLFPAAVCAETVVASFYPVWLMALNLTEGIGGLDVVNLTDSSVGCLHEYTLQPSDMVALSGADVLLVNGGGMEPFLPVVTGAFPDLPVVDASADIRPPVDEGTLNIPALPDGESVNPHFWLDPQYAAAMAAALAEGLIRCLPAYEQQITDNLAAYTDRLRALDLTIQDELRSVPKKKVIVFHEAFPYFVRACGLPVLAMVNKEPEDDLPSSQLGSILNLISGEDPLPLIVKSEEEDRSVSVLVQESGISVCALDPVVSGPEHPPLDYYEACMVRNLSLLKQALQ